jgi:hypothetical protein
MTTNEASSPLSTPPVAPADTLLPPVPSSPPSGPLASQGGTGGASSQCASSSHGADPPIVDPAVLLSNKQALLNLYLANPSCCDGGLVDGVKAEIATLQESLKPTPPLQTRAAAIHEKAKLQVWWDAVEKEHLAKAQKIEADLARAIAAKESLDAELARAKVYFDATDERCSAILASTPMEGNSIPVSGSLQSHVDTLMPTAEELRSTISSALPPQQADMLNNFISSVFAAFSAQSVSGQRGEKRTLEPSSQLWAQMGDDDMDGVNSQINLDGYTPDYTLPSKPSGNITNITDMTNATASSPA